MSCYTKHMSIARPPGLSPEVLDRPCYTNVQSRGNLTIHSEIDYIWVSKPLGNRITTMTIDDGPSRWRAGPQNLSYHKALTMEIYWPRLWEGQTHSTSGKEDNGSEGMEIELGPDLSRATLEQDSEYSRRVEWALEKPWKTLHNTFKGRLPPARKLEILYNEYQNTHLRIAIQVYGRKRPRKPYTKPEATEATVAWDSLYKEISAYTSKTGKLPPTDTAHARFCDTVRSHIHTLKERGLATPPLENWSDLLKWVTARDFHRGQVTGARDTYKITDAEALANPKKLTRLICKPPGSATITSLKRGNDILVGDAEIAQELEAYLGDLGGQEEEIWDMENHPEYTPRGPRRRLLNPHLADLVTAKVQPHEINATLADLPNGAAAGVLSPRLVKAAASKPWTRVVDKTAKQIESETLKREWETSHGFPPVEGPIETTRKITEFPTRSIKLLRMIVQAALQTKNLPSPEKAGTVTGLPKVEGLITSVHTIRPITVSPIIGRIINNVMAKRFAGALEKHSILNSAQMAFLPGKNIHQAISSVLQCFSQSKHAKNGHPGKACFAVFYDISKAYDTVKWSSIQHALAAIGAPDNFIDFVMHSLKGTSLRMKTNVPGKATKYVEMHKAIKQGCPLAPILFTVVLNDLHDRCKAIGGYTLRSTGSDTSVASRGYCDDTVIIADDFATLERLNHCVADFFREHGFQLNATKTYFLGREGDGSCTKRKLHWPGTTTPFLPRDLDYPVRYLGLWLNLNLTWRTQIAKMTASIMGLVSHVKHRRITLLQAALMIRYVIGKKLEIGFRHATISREQLRDWDRWLKDAITARAEVPLPRLHSSSVMPILKTLDLERTYILDKTIGILDNLIKTTDLRPHFQSTFAAATSGGEEADKSLGAALASLKAHGITITRNDEWTNIEKVAKSTQADTTLRFEGKEVPVRLDTSQYTLWGAAFTPEAGTIAVMCTDGSADPRDRSKNAGAAIVYLVDDFAEDEYDNAHQFWTILGHDNYAAELAAINKAIRSVPVTVPIKLYTDSLSAILAIETHRRTGGATAPTAQHARPYLRAIASALRARDTRQTPTVLEHIRAHTGLRDLASIGNEAADRHAKAALHEQPPTSDIDPTKFELQFMVSILAVKSTGAEETTETSPRLIHGNIRQTLHRYLTDSLLAQWATRRVRGELIRDYGTGTLALIDDVWKTPTSAKLTMLLDFLNQADKPPIRPGGGQQPGERSTHT